MGSGMPPVADGWESAHSPSSIPLSARLRAWLARRWLAATTGSILASDAKASMSVLSSARVMSAMGSATARSSRSREIGIDAGQAHRRCQERKAERTGGWR
jgi:hypothetical protein